jgi:hypothetical protein
MATTLHQENLDVGASENTIQSILSFSKSTAVVPISLEIQELEELFKN